MEMKYHDINKKKKDAAEGQSRSPAALFSFSLSLSLSKGMKKEGTEGRVQGQLHLFLD
jgi:hypothetical protein